MQLSVIPAILRTLLYRLRRTLKNRQYTPNTKALFSNEQIEIGDYTYGTPRILFTGGSNKLSIGRFCSIAADVHILLGGQHHDEFVSTYPFYHTFSTIKRWNRNNIPIEAWQDRIAGDVLIGNDVWIGRGATIMPGVSIGDGAIIGAETVITKDVPPYAIVVGTPPRIVRFRFSEQQIEDLLKIQWWNWEADRIQQELPFIMSNNIDAFILRHKI